MGKYVNARVTAEIFNKRLRLLFPEDEVKIVYNQYVSLLPRDGYVLTKFGQGSGSCWTVSVLGGIIDEANTYWNNNYGYPLFVIKESHPHSSVSETYSGVNDGYGYNIYYEQDENGKWRDYVFQVNPIAENDIVALVFEFYALDTDPNAYRGENIGGDLYVLLK